MLDLKVVQFVKGYMLVYVLYLDSSDLLNQMRRKGSAAWS